MRRTVLWILGGIAVVIVLALLTAVSFAQYTVKRSFPDLSGEVSVTGLTASVDVLRDERGIPSIYADTLADLIFTQGYVHAQDRFWEMDVRRHITAGRLSEMFGESQVDTDQFLRTLGWRRIAEEEVGLLSDRSRLMLDSYAAGVNAYLADRSPADISLEYTILGLQNPGYSIEPWQPADSVAWLKALAWDLRGNMTDEVYRTLMAATTDRERTEELFPPYPFDRHRPIVAADDLGAVPQAVASVITDATPALMRTSANAALLDTWLAPTGRGIGSNSWAVSGRYTETGLPILANDPHLGPSIPSLWYQNGLRCRATTPDCPLQVAGWSMAGLPGVFIGHTDSFAWGFTNTGPDVTDLVLEQIEGDSYVVDGEARPLTIRTETIEVAGGDPVEVTIRSTDSGPIISDAAEVYADVGGDYAVALRWTALTPGTTFDAFDLLNSARDFDGFREAARKLEVPAQNLLYAGVDGTIAYQMPGRIPIRRGYDGKWPVPGWNSDYAWTGYIPFDDLPATVDPPEGWIVTANQAVIGPEYPYFITDDWSYGSRSQRIVDLIEAQIAEGRPFSVADMQAMQMDSWNANAEFLVPRLSETGATNDELSLLDGWDYQQPRDSAPAAYFNAFWRQLITRMFDSHLDTEQASSSGDDQFFEVIRDLWEQPDNPWWDDPATPEIEDRNAMVTTSLTRAADELRGIQGEDPSSWAWGELHTLLLEHSTLGTSGIGPIEALFNRGPVATSGGSGIVNATGWTPSDGYQVTWVPSMRQVVDLADFDASTWVNLTGNSGHAYAPTYADQVVAWQTGEQFPWPWTAAAVESATTDRLTLIPTS